MEKNRLSGVEQSVKMRTTLTAIKAQLRDFYPEREIESFIYLILEAVCRLDKHSVLCRKDRDLSPHDRARIQEIVEELKKYRPIQYILGETEFYGLKFKVNEKVLIPRPETEELVEWIINDYRDSDSALDVLEIGTGSGCIAVSLAKNLPRASVYASDISEAALEVAERNREINRTNIRFIHHDIFKKWPAGLPEKWDVIASNPPYVSPAEKETMPKNVLNYEPHQALFVPQKKPLLFYERIAQIGLNRLKENGSIYFEINALYAKETVKMLKDNGYRTVRLLKDISGKERMIKLNL